MSERVTVYRFKFYDGISDEWRFSRRWGTWDGIVATKTGVVIRDSAVDIDEGYLVGDGMTERDFDPHSPYVPDGGFQKMVR